MSREVAEIRRCFNSRMAESERTGSFYGTVQSVDEQERTCVVAVNGITYEEVLLFAVADSGMNGLLLVPKTGSDVIISKFGAGNNYFVDIYSEIDKIMFTNDDVGIDISEGISIDAFGNKIIVDSSAVELNAGAKLVVNSNTINISNGSQTLGGILSAICDALLQLTVSTGVGPSGTPLNAASFVKILQDIEATFE